MSGTDRTSWPVQSGSPSDVAAYKKATPQVDYKVQNSCQVFLYLFIHFCVLVIHAFSPPFYTCLILPLSTTCQSPGSQRKTLEMQHLGPDIPHKRGGAKYYTENVDSVISIMDQLACASAGHTPLLVRLHRARERLRNKRSLEIRGRLARVACCDRK